MRYKHRNLTKQLICNQRRVLRLGMFLVLYEELHDPRGPVSIYYDALLSDSVLFYSLSLY